MCPGGLVALPPLEGWECGLVFNSVKLCPRRLCPNWKGPGKRGGGRRRLLQSRLCKLAQLRAEPTTTNSAAHRSNGRAKIISSGGAPFFLLASAPHPPYFPSAPTPHLFLCCQPANDMQGWSERQPDIKARRKGHFPLLDKKVTLRLRFFGFF